MTTAEPCAPVTSTAATPADVRWNAGALAVDMASFNVGMSFISTTTVLPALITTLGGTEVLVGVASGIASGAWLLPQLLVASFVARLPRKQPFMVRTAWLTRPIMLVLALIILFFGETRPGVVLATIIAGTGLFFVFDAMVSVPGSTSSRGPCPPRVGDGCWAAPRWSAASAASWPA